MEEIEIQLTEDQIALLKTGAVNSEGEYRLTQTFINRGEKWFVKVEADPAFHFAVENDLSLFNRVAEFRTYLEALIHIGAGIDTHNLVLGNFYGAGLARFDKDSSDDFVCQNRPTNVISLDEALLLVPKMYEMQGRVHPRFWFNGY